MSTLEEVQVEFSALQGSLNCGKPAFFLVLALVPQSTVGSHSVQRHRRHLSHDMKFGLVDSSAGQTLSIGTQFLYLPIYSVKTLLLCNLAKQLHVINLCSGD